MSTENRRLYSHLWINVAEAKNLPKMNKTGEADPYVVVAAAEHSVRTRTIWRDRKHPFWGEDFELEVKEPEKLQNVTFTIFDAEKLGKDEPIGRVTVKSFINFEFQIQFFGVI